MLNLTCLHSVILLLPCMGFSCVHLVAPLSLLAMDLDVLVCKLVVFVALSCSVLIFESIYNWDDPRESSSGFISSQCTGFLPPLGIFFITTEKRITLLIGNPGGLESPRSSCVI
jgi:hypothetical protein